MSKEDVMDYVMTTPSNPNRAVLSGMLDSIADAGGGSRVLLYENDAVTVDQDGMSPLKYTQFSPFEPMQFATWSDDKAFSIEVDGEIAFTGAASIANKIGLTSPGDASGVEEGKSVGVEFSIQNFTMPDESTGVLLFGIKMLIIDTSKHSGNTHSIKIYKEV